MKKLLLFLISVLVSYSLFGQSVITYSYDSAGNRTTRNMSEINVALLPTNESAIIFYDYYSLKRESGLFNYAFETSIFHNTEVLGNQTIGGCHKTNEWKNIEIMVNDSWHRTRRKLNVRDRNDEKDPTL